MPKNFEITDEITAVLRADFRNDRFNAITECPMSENVIAYALEELEPGSNSDVENHLATCRICTGLVGDVRSAADESQLQDNQPVEVLPPLARAINRSKKPSLLKKMQILIPNFSMPPIYLKIAAAAATACLAFIVIQFGVQNTDNFESYPKAVEQRQAVRKKVVSPEQTVNQAKPLKKTSNRIYSIHSITDNGRRVTDPFEPVFGNETPTSVVRKKRARRMPRTPLETLDISQLKLVGTILSDEGNKAMVEDASGKGYVLNEGTYVGRNSGRVTRILKDKVIIEEEMENNDGQIIIFERVLNLNKH